MDIQAKNKVTEILPQRYPFLFIDRVLEFNKKEGKIICLKNLTVNEYFFSGHFPGNPIMPGVVIIEAMAQASILLFAGLKPEIAEKKPQYFLGKVEAKFLKTVIPGDQLILEICKEKILAGGGIVTAQARVKQTPVAKAKISFGVKIKDE
jgi:3-hydroxyacyl-[acyl-carrier-protein] dehydratase